MAFVRAGRQLSLFARIPGAPARDDSRFSAASRQTWPGRGGRPMVDGEPGSAGVTESREIMKLAVSEAPPATAALDEQLISRLMFQRIILLGTEVDDQVAN